MGEQERLSRESFLFLARAAGLNPGDPHLEKLHTYLLEVLPKMQGTAEPAGDLHTIINRYMPQLKRLADLDLAGLDPAMVFRPRGGKD